MHERFGHFAHHLIELYGCPALFGILFCCGLGLPLPEDVPLLFAGAFIFHKQMNPVTAAVCAWCGIIGGDCVLYMLGRRYGHGVSKIPIIGRHLDMRRIARVEIWFKQYGVWVVAVGRMFAGIRGVMVVVAGTSKFKFWKFIIADGLAAIVSGGLFVILGYTFAEHQQRLGEIVGHIKGGMLIGLCVTLTVLLIYVWRWHLNRNVEARGFPIAGTDGSDEPINPASSSSDAN